MNKTSAVETLKKRIEAKRAALRRRGELKRLIEESSSSVYTLEGEHRELGYRLGEFSNAEQHTERQARLQAERDRVNQALEQARMRNEALHTELKRLECETIPGALQKTTLADILPHQAELAERHASIKRLEGVIRDQRALIKTSQDAIPTIQDRSSARAEVLARLAIGEAKQQELVELDALIERERESAEAISATSGPVITQAHQTIAGLENKVGELRAEIAELNQQTPFALEQYLNSEIEHACAVYMEHAKAVKDAFVSVVAMEYLMKRATGQDMRQVMPRLLKLPCPTLEEYRDQGSRNESGVLFNADSIYSPMATYQAVEAEIIKRMHAKGCTLL